MALILVVLPNFTGPPARRILSAGLAGSLVRVHVSVSPLRQDVSDEFKTAVKACVLRGCSFEAIADDETTLTAARGQHVPSDYNEIVRWEPTCPSPGSGKGRRKENGRRGSSARRFRSMAYFPERLKQIPRAISNTFRI